MQITNTNNGTSFGRIGFANKATKEAFYKKLNDKRSYNSLNQESRLLREHFTKFVLEKEANRHDRLFKIGMTKVKGNDVFTCQGEPLMVEENGKQSFFKFVTGLFFMNNAKYRNAMADTMVKKGMI